MTPFDRAFRWHHQHGGGIEFSEVIEAHAQTGVVLITPTVFLVGRKVRRTWAECRILNPWATAEDGDCWHVWLAAGNWWEIWEPEPLPWFSWHRHGRLKFFAAAKWRGKIGHAHGAGHGQFLTIEAAASTAARTGPEIG